MVKNSLSDSCSKNEVRQALSWVGAEGAEFCRRVFAASDLPSPSAAVLAEMVPEVATLRNSHSVQEAAALLPMASARALARLRGRSEAPGAHLRHPHNEDDAHSLGVERPFVGFFALERHTLRHKHFDGGMSPDLDRLVFASGDAVTVLPYDPRQDRVLLIEQFRAGPFARCDRLPWCLETIAGRCDAGEDVETTARREAREEAGLELGRMERILAYYPTPAIAAEHITSFVGEADLAREHGIFGLDTEDEDIRAFAVPRAEAMAGIASGEINNAPLALSLLWLDLNADRLRRTWSG